MSRSREDDSWSWQHCWQLQRSLVISTNTPDGGNPEGAIRWRRMIRSSRTRIKNVRLRDSGEDLRMRSKSWEDDSELAAQLANATQPGHFNKRPQWRRMIRGSRTRIKNMRLRDSGEDLRMRSKSWEDDSELAAQLAKATQSGHFNKCPRRR